MKTSIIAILIATASFMTACGNKSSEETIQMEEVQEPSEQEFIEESPVIEETDSIPEDTTAVPEPEVVNP